MPRAGGVYSAPPGTKGNPNTTIESAKYNALVDDLVADANAARPVTAGGSGSNTAVGGADAFSPAGADMASAATVNLANATGTLVNITGTVTITALGTVAAGAERVLVFGGALILTYNATSLILPGAANIATAAGDIAVMRSLGGGNWRCVSYQRAAVAPFSNTAPTFINSVSLQSTDAGAAAGPIAELFRDSASPAASDLLAQIPFYGRDSAANKELYASIFAKILDPTSTSEDAILAFATIVAGTLATRFNMGAGLYSEGVTGGDKGAGTINVVAAYANGARIGGAPDAVMEDQKPNGTAPQFIASGSWVTRDLNTETRDPSSLVSISGNQFTVAVDGWVDWDAPMLTGTLHKSRLFNVTDGVVTAYGTSERSDDAGAYATSSSKGGADVVAGKTYRIEHRNSQSGGGGQESSFGATEVYTRVKFWRTA
jgi:hypothetical protein